MSPDSMTTTLVTEGHWGRAARKLGRLATDENTTFTSAWLITYSTAFGPRESYSGTSTRPCDEHASCAMLQLGQFFPYTPTRSPLTRPPATRAEPRRSAVWFTLL